MSLESINRSILEHRLEVRRWMGLIPISGHVAESLSFEVERDPRAWHELLLIVRAEMLRHQLPPESITKEMEFAIDVPASWWQHFKQAHANTPILRHLARLWPVVTTITRQTQTLTVNLTRFHNYPDAPAVLNAYAGVAIHDYGQPTTTWSVKSTVWPESS